MTRATPWDSAALFVGRVPRTPLPMTDRKHDRGPSRPAAHAGPREAFDAWLTRDLRRQYGQPVQSPLPPDLEAAVNALLEEFDPERK